MKTCTSFLFMTGLLLASACGTKQEQQATEKPLYDQVMDVHDEVMPFMGELNRLKRELTDKLTIAQDMPLEERQSLEQTIQKIDSASRGMMVWMREFNPEAYEGEEKQRYLEQEMVHVQKIKTDILEALEEGRKASQ